MSAEDKNKLDELFKNGLDVPNRHFDFSDADWNAMEQKLDTPKKGGVVYWLPYLSAVAAVLLMFVGWWFFKPAKVEEVKPNVVVNQSKDTGATTAGSQTGAANNAGIQTPEAGSPSKSTLNGLQPAAQKENGQLAQNTAAEGGHTTKHIKVTNNGQNAGAVKNNELVAPGSSTGDIIANAGVPKNEKPVAATPENTAPVTNPAVKNNAQPITPAIKSNTEVIAQAPENNNADSNANAIAETGKTPKIKKDKGSAGRSLPQFAITVLVSPDINGVGSFKQKQWGQNAGLLFSVGLSKKLTVSTGLAYSKKPYLTAYSNYVSSYKFKTEPTNVMADCRVLDVPLNVDYKLYNKGKNAFSVGTGLSSYFMLKETYTYQFAPGHAYGPSDYTVTNKNRHILGVLNLNTTYQRQLSKKFSVGVQPYLKIPLTDIGNSRVKLQSAGVAVGVSWNINSKNP